MHTLAAECTNNKNVSEAEYSLAARHGHAMPYKLGQTRVVGDRAVFYTALEADEALASRTRYSTERARFCRFACVSIACVLCLCYFGLPPDLCDIDLQQMSSSSLTNNDILVSLLNVPFSRRSDIERNEILKRGRPTPKVSILKKYKDRSRSFQSSCMTNINGYVVMEKSQNYFVGLVYCWAQRRLYGLLKALMT